MKLKTIEIDSPDQILTCVPYARLVLPVLSDEAFVPYSICPDQHDNIKTKSSIKFSYAILIVLLT